MSIDNGLNPFRSVFGSLGASGAFPVAPPAPDAADAGDAADGGEADPLAPLDTFETAPPPLLIYGPPSGPRRFVAPSGTPPVEATSDTPPVEARAVLPPVVPPSSPPPVEAPSVVTPVEGRNGSILSSDTILKADHFPGIQRLEENGGVAPDDAPNFRELDGEGIYGLGQPTVDGIRDVLDRTGAGPGGTGRHAVWTTLREENVIYVKGRPYTLRAADEPNRNRSREGRAADEIERDEVRLEQEILDEAARNGGYITLHREDADGRTVPERVRIDGPQDVQTPKEVFEGLRALGYDVDYKRVPITDEMTPEDRDFDALTRRVAGAGPDDAIIMNCHQGKGRTTTAMTAASELRHAQREQPSPSQPAHERPAMEKDIADQLPSEADPARRGVAYRNLRSLVDSIGRSLQGTGDRPSPSAADPAPGRAFAESQRETDAIIDRNQDMTNLRHDIGNEWSKGTPEARAKALEYLERYFSLISYDMYCNEQAAQGFRQPYSEWRKQHPELDDRLEAMKQDLLRGES